jgi:hypothetical protein
MGDDGGGSDDSGTTTTAASQASAASAYSNAWNEGEDKVTTYKDIDNGRSALGENLKTVKPKDKTQVKGGKLAK